MESSILFLAVFSMLNYVARSEIRLTESGGGVLKPGESLRLTCRVSGHTITSDSTDWAWIRQAPNKGLEWIGEGYYIRSSSQWKPRYAPAFQNRVSISLDTSKNEYDLQLSSVTAADTATYHCARRGYIAGATYYYRFDYWGQGTMVTVTTATPTAPAVFPLSPCCQDTADVTLACLITGYFPEPVQVQWNSGAITSGFKTFPSIQQSSGHHTLSSQLTISDTRWKSDKFQCNVVHTATSSRIDKDFEPCQSKDPVAPVVRMLQSSCTTHPGNMELLCMISNFYPKEFTVSWLRDGEVLPDMSAESLWKDANSYTFSATSSTNVTQQDWLNSETYSCQVSHAQTNSVVKAQVKKCGGDYDSTQIKVYIESPNPYDLHVEKRPKLTCKVFSMNSDETLAVTWSREKSGGLNPEPLDISEQSNGTFTAISIVQISESDWLAEEKFSCRVQHQELPGGSITVDGFWKKVPVIAPAVYLFHPHSDELNSDSQDLSITALIKGFKPSDIFVKWLEGSNPLPEDNYINTPVTSDGGGTFFLYSKLKVTKADWNNGNSYTCMVVHEGLAIKFIQKSIRKNPGK